MAIVLSEYGVQAVYKTKKRERGVTCDICGRFIEAVDRWPYDTAKYFKVTTGHNNWGNDSCDSIERKDICPECVSGFVVDYLQQNGYSTAYINIETEHTYPAYRWDDGLKEQRRVNNA